MKKLIDYLKEIGTVKELYSNHTKALIELQTEKETLWVFRYISIKGKIVYGLSKLISTEGKGKIINSLEAKVLKDRIALKKEIGKIIKPLQNEFNQNNYTHNHSMEHIL